MRDGTELQLEGAEMDAALQYGPSRGAFTGSGSAPWLERLQKHVHSPPLMKSSDKPSSTSMMVTTGSQDGLAKIFDMCLSRGDTVVVDKPSYPGTLAALRALHVHPMSIPVDPDGMNVDILADKLSSADAGVVPKPKVVYVQSSCSNPAGVGLSLHRRKQLIELANLYDLLVIEDDPYFYVSFGGAARLPSLLSLDTHGRVIRLDSFSKILSSGLRVGFVSGPEALVPLSDPGPGVSLVSRLELHQQVSTMHCSSLSQLLVAKLLNNWGLDGFLEHTKRVAEFYKRQCDLMTAAIDEHCQGLLTYSRPSGGMFIWLRAADDRIVDTADMINERALGNDVLLVPGNVFQWDESKPSDCMRAAYSTATEEQMQMVCCGGGGCLRS